jgi:hypothetical protein
MKTLNFVTLSATVMISGGLSALAGTLANIEDPVIMKKFLESQIIAPTSIDSTQRSMEGEGFKCSIRIDSTFGKYMRYLYCFREDQRPHPALWEIALEISGPGLNGNVAVIKTFPKNRATDTQPHNPSRR